jgi:hypothetical protein
MLSIFHAGAPTAVVGDQQDENHNGRTLNGRFQNVDTVVDPAPFACRNSEQRNLEWRFATIFNRARNTTGLFQTFYKQEFDRAHAGLQYPSALDETPPPGHAAKTSDPDIDAVFLTFDKFLDELKQTGDKGLKFRLWRDGISLVTGMALLAIMTNALMSQDECQADDFRAANSPIGSCAADWGLILCEWSKGLVTTSLSYPTLKRHHLVDEFVKRMTASAALLAACLENHAATSPMTNASRWEAVKWGALQCTEKGRDVSTLFTLLNSALPVARGLLWSAESAGGGATPASWRGLLRLAQNGSDSLRSVFSTIGTVSRNTLFGIELGQLKTALPALRAQLRLCNAKQVLQQLEKTELLFSHCSTPLLSRIAASKELLSDFIKDTEISSPDQLKRFFDNRKIPFTAASDAPILYSEAPENHWGKRLADETYKSTFSTTLRVPYRLTLEMQHQMGRPSEAMTAFRTTGKNSVDQRIFDKAGAKISSRLTQAQRAALPTASGIASRMVSMK